MDKGGKKQNQIDRKSWEESFKQRKRKESKQTRQEINQLNKKGRIHSRERIGVGNQGNKGNHGANLNVFDDFSMIFR